MAAAGAVWSASAAGVSLLMGRTATWPGPPWSGRRHGLVTPVRCVQAADDGLPRRRLLVAAATATAAAVAGAPALAAKGSNVRLRDVEDPAMQEGVRAATNGELDRADRIFTYLVERQPEWASAWSNRGNVRLQQGRPEAAIADFTRAIALAPEAPVPLLNRAIAWEALERFQEAVADCNAAIALDPDEFAAWFNRGNVLVKMAEYDRALADYSRAAVLAPGLAAYRFKEASVLFQIGREADAERVLRSLVRKYPAYAEARVALAAVYWAEGKASPAEEQFLAGQEQDGRLRDLRYVHSTLRWTPRLEDALRQFIALESPAALSSPG